MKTIRIFTIIFFVALLGVVVSCKEEERRIGDSEDSVPPNQPIGITYKPLYGGARFFYEIPGDEDLLSIDAVYTNNDGKTFSFSSSYYKDSLDVYGFGDTIEYQVDLYAIDRAGNRSEPAQIMVKPLKPAIARVAESIEVKPGFSSFFLDWENDLEQSINIYVDFSFNEDGVDRELTSVFSSNLKEERRFIENLDLGPEQPVSVKLRVEDIYGNITEPMDKGTLTLYEDMEIPKDSWVLPATNDSIGGVPQCFGDGLEGRLRYVIDGIIDRGDNLNFMHTHGRGRTGEEDDGNMPWNFIIDLGDYYELSRIVTVQRHSGGLDNINRGQYYRSENVGVYEMYYWDEDSAKWSIISEHQIPVPKGLSELEFVKKGEAGDMAYMYPDDPKYTKPTRWFRYRAMKGFTSNYTREDANCLSELTLYGRKAVQ
ncbi:DUF4959 domain-containing protein [Sunxiuqinia elliptica]|uniref:Uncharacterized protein n=1 Tax=Sunxiuqinia elliptica TaxID=655355 RepID=A0A1I2JK47_9BACT|nr:DUF4959 domain-containing protein [Sunxiuqinia elliptica]SFF53196.1 protein of unknown function [Sunxiuqinia elliptica]